MANEVSFEQRLWNAADTLRGSMDASEYKHVVLGLIFLKYISDSFEDRYNELKVEGKGFEEDKDEYLCDNIFFVPEKARWSYICENSKNFEIGKIIDEAMLLIEKENEQLKNILPKNYARPELDKIRLGSVVDEFTNLQLKGKDEQDLLGRAYEYCLTMFAQQEGKRGGEFYTPESVVKTLVEVLEPTNGRVFDPACGSGGMFVQSAKFIEAHAGNRENISIYGQEFNPTTYKMCKMNLAIRGLEIDLGAYSADSFTDDQHKTLKADYVIANPPFNMDFPNISMEGDVRFKYGLPPKGNANYGWIQHMLHHTNDKGKIGIVLANGSLSTQTSGEGEIRKNLLEADLIEAIVAMPSQLFYTTQIPVCIWFLNKDKKQKEKTLFIDAREMGEMENRTLRVLTEEDIKTIANTVHSFQNDNNYEDKKGFCKVVNIEEIRKQDYILTPGIYVDIKESENLDTEPFDEKMNRLTSELSDLFKKGDELQEEVRKQLGGMGYDV